MGHRDFWLHKARLASHVGLQLCMRAILLNFL